MQTKTLLITSLIGGVLSALLTNLPVVNLVNCVVCAGFWFGPLLAVWLYRRQAGAVTLGQAVGVGTLAGVWHGLIGFALSFAGLAGIQAVVNSYAQLVPEGTGIEGTLGTLEATAMNLVGAVVSVAFGALGGLIGGALFKGSPRPVTPAAA